MSNELPPVELITPRLRLRAPHRDDAEVLAANLGNYDVSKMLAKVPHPYTLEMAHAWIDTPRINRMPFIIEMDGQMAGSVALRKFDTVADLGYWMVPEYWGRGIMSEAASAALAWLFDTTDHQRVVAGCIEGNHASFRIMQKLGFTITGNSQVHCLARGENLPHIDTELLRSRFTPLTS